MGGRDARPSRGGPCSNPRIVFSVSVARRARETLASGARATARARGGASARASRRASARGMEFLPACFALLGLDGIAREGASVTREDVRRAFRERLVRAHPDRNFGCQRAYDALCRARDEANEAIDRRDLLASTYDWRATRRRDESRATTAEESATRATRAGDGRDGDATTDPATTSEEFKRFFTRFECVAFAHETRVTTVATTRDVVAVGELNGRVSCWRADGSFIASCDSTSKERNAVSFLRFNRVGRLAATFVTSKPRFWTVDATAMSAPLDSDDGHERRVTAATWFEDGDAQRDVVERGDIHDVFVTAALDGSIFARSFDHTVPNVRVVVDECRAVKALSTLATSPNEGALVVGDLAGTFQLWRVAVRVSSESGAKQLIAEPLTNVVKWSGFGGITATRLARFASSFRLLTVFDDASTRGSRVLEWTIPNERGKIAHVRGFSGAIPSANSTMRGAVAAFVTARASASDDDDDDDEDTDDGDETHLIAVDDAILCVDASTRAVLYVADVEGCRALAPSSRERSAFIACRFARSRVAFDVRSLDDGAPSFSCDMDEDEFFRIAPRSRAAFAHDFASSDARARPVARVLAHDRGVVAHRGAIALVVRELDGARARGVRECAA